MSRVLVLVLSALLSASALAVVETYEFDNAELRARYHALIFELRCPKCQNQNLADSDAPIASDLREQVYRLLNENKGDGEVKDYLVERYGEFVLYNPPVNKHTAMLWLLPAAGLLLGLIVIVMILRRSKQSGESGDLGESEKQRLANILNDKEQQN